MTGYLVPVLLLHILAACLWIGGLLFLSIVLAPFARRRYPPRDRALLLSHIGEAFTWPSWITLAVLGVTGVGLVIIRHIDAGGLTQGFWHALLTKIVLVIVIVALNYIHVVHRGPAYLRRLEALPDGDDVPAPLTRDRRRLTRIGVAETVLSIGVAGIGVYLTVTT